jgi:DNA primase
VIGLKSALPTNLYIYWGYSSHGTLISQHIRGQIVFFYRIFKWKMNTGNGLAFTYFSEPNTRMTKRQLFANIIIKLVHQQHPYFTTLERMIFNHNGKMYLDFLQNRPGATIAGVYSIRPKPGAAVSMPVTWAEGEPGLTMRGFTIHNSIGRLKETSYLFNGILGEGIDLMKTIQNSQTIF